MRVQVHDHAAHGRFHQLPVVDGFDVFLLDPVEHLGEQPGLVPRQGFAGLLQGLLHVPLGQHAAAQRQAEAKDGADDQHQETPEFQ